MRTPSRRDFFGILAAMAAVCVPEPAKSKKITVRYLFSSDEHERCKIDKPHLNADKDTYAVYQSGTFVGHLSIHYICRSYLELRDRRCPTHASLRTWFDLLVLSQELPINKWEWKLFRDETLCNNNPAMNRMHNTPLQNEAMVRKVAKRLLNKAMDKMEYMIEKFKSVGQEVSRG